jgi:hypothetical protein
VQTRCTTHSLTALLAFGHDRGAGLSPCARNTIREAISRDTRRAASMQDTLPEGTARAAQLAPSAVTASAVGGSATPEVWLPTLSDDERLVGSVSRATRLHRSQEICVTTNTLISAEWPTERWASWARKVGEWARKVGEWARKVGEWARKVYSSVICRHFEKSRYYRPNVRIANPQISRRSGAQRAARLQTDAHPSRDGFEQFGPGTQGHTAKFEPGAWSWAQMTKRFE